MVFAQVCLMVIERLKWLNWRKIHSCVCACISWKIDLPAQRANTPEIFWWEHFEFNGRFYLQRLKYFVLVFFVEFIYLCFGYCYKMSEMIDRTFYNVASGLIQLKMKKDRFFIHKMHVKSEADSDQNFNQRLFSITTKFVSICSHVSISFFLFPDH